MGQLLGLLVKEMNYRYQQVYDGEWFAWDRTKNKEQCCGCGLVHIVDYRVTGRKIEARYTVDKRATARVRKKDGIRIIRKK